MKKTIKTLENINKAYLVTSSLIGLFIALILGVHKVLNNNEEILETIKTTQQMALKSVIWNENIPLGERASACDVYLNAGYNSLTKKECQVIIDKGTEQGLF